MKGWTWVGGQAMLLGALLLLPGRTDWWEEQLLSERFADYSAYASTTPKFIPRPSIGGFQRNS